MGIFFVITGCFVLWVFYDKKNDDNFVEIESANDEVVIDIDNLKKAQIDYEDKNILIELEKDNKDNRENKANNSDKSAESGLSEKVLYSVPFVSQAPFGNWDKYHEESCEEASLIMLERYLKMEKKISKKDAEKEIQKMIKFEIDKYGDYRDSNMQEIVQLAKDFYGLDNLKVIYDFNKGDLKKWLNKGNPIIVPTAGRLLNNPYYTPPGPFYHNLVIIGHNKDKIITNDPGTKRGAGYEYNLDILYNAIHDFPGKKEDIQNGRKAMIVVKI